ncbi:acyl-ACP desaturase, partial [Nocardia sp. NPDC003345]
MTSTTEKHDLGVMTYLAPVVADNLDRHLSLTKEWFPHQFVPWSEGSNFDGPLGGDPWEPGQSRLSEHA